MVTSVRKGVERRRDFPGPSVDQTEARRRTQWLSGPARRDNFGSGQTAPRRAGSAAAQDWADCSRTGCRNLHKLVLHTRSEGRRDLRFVSLDGLGAGGGGAGDPKSKAV